MFVARRCVSVCAKGGADGPAGSTLSHPPISYPTVDRTRRRFLLIHGTTDDVVDSSQSRISWSRSTRRASPCAGSLFQVPVNFWASDPFEGEPGKLRCDGCAAYSAVPRRRALAQVKAMHRLIRQQTSAFMIPCGGVADRQESPFTLCK